MDHKIHCLIGRLLLTVCCICWLSLAFADVPPTAVFGLNKAGIFRKYNKVDGTSVVVRVLNASALHCANQSPGFAGLVFDPASNYFYTSCGTYDPNPIVETPAKIVRFSFVPGDEIVYAEHIYNRLFTKLVRSDLVNNSGEVEFGIFAKGNGPFNGATWWNFRVPNKVFVYTGRTDLYASPVGACGGISAIATKVSVVDYLNPPAASSSYYATAEIKYLDTAPGYAIGKIESMDSSYCFRILCFLAAPPGAVSSLNSGFMFDYDNVVYDRGAAEMWGQSVIYGSPAADNVLVRLKHTTSNDFCTGTYNGAPTVNPAIDISPKVLGLGTTASIVTNMVGIETAPDYYQFPPAPPSFDVSLIWKPVEMLLLPNGY